LNRLNSIIKQSSEIKDFKAFDIEDEWNLFRSKIDVTIQEDKSRSNLDNKESNQQIINLLMTAAGLILIFAVISVFYRPSPEVSALTAGPNKNDTLQLIDGSEVVLNPSSTLTYFLTLNHETKRTLHLEGNGEFAITKSILPMRVFLDKLVVDIIGTRFTIKNINQSTEISNTEGSVKVSQIANSENFVILKAGDTYIFKDGVFFNISDTIVIKEEHINEPTPKGQQKKEHSAEPATVIKEIKGSRYKLGSVIKDYLIKFNKKKVKLDKKAALDMETIVRLDDINKSYFEILKDLKKQGIIDFRPGDCADCYIITAPEKQ
jgi:hypothetical protein